MPKIRVAGTTIDSSATKTYSSQEVFELINTSFQNGYEKGKTEGTRKSRETVSELELALRAKDYDLRLYEKALKIACKYINVEELLKTEGTEFLMNFLLKAAKNNES